jgi:uncharacterized cofD-like protein
MKKKRVVAIGGGTGTHTVLQGLKQYQETLHLTAVITMADSGGSTGRLRDEFGQLPVGDARMALVALAREVDDHEELLRQLFLYRFDRGDGLSGHNFGNLFLVALTDILGSEEAAIRTAAKVLRVTGDVFPVTTQLVDLVATYDDGVVVTGEHDIDEPPRDRHTRTITDLTVTPGVRVSAAAVNAISEADLIVLGPGDLYTSVLANIVVPGVATAVKNSSAKVVYVCNLMTKVGQTTNYGLSRHVAEITRYLGRAPDVVLANDTPLPQDLLARYAKAGEFPVQQDQSDQAEVITGDLLASEAVHQKSGDTLKRSLIRHDANKLATQLVALL